MCTLSAVHKSQMFFLSAGPRAVNMLEQGDANQTTTNKCFLLPTAAILEQITKGLFRTLDSGKPKTCIIFFCFFSEEGCQCFLETCSFFMVSFFRYQVDEGVSFLSLFWSAVLAGWHTALSGLNKQLWHMGRMYSHVWAAQQRQQGTCGNVKPGPDLCLKTWSVFLLCF